MVKIQRADTPAVNDNTAMQPAMPMSFGTAGAKAVAGLGNAAGRLAAQLEVEDAKRGKDELDLKMIKFQNDHQLWLRQRQASFNVDQDDPNAFYNATANEARERINGFYGTVPPEHINAVRKWGERLYGTTQNNLYGFRTERAREQHVNMVGRTIQSEIMKISAIPNGSFQTHFDSIMAGVEKVISRNETLTASDKARLRRQAAEYSIRALEARLDPGNRIGFGRDVLGKLKVELNPDGTPKVPVGEYKPSGVLVSGTAKSKAFGWARTNSTWKGLDQFEKAAVMALMEANGMNINDARNALSAMINRASKGKEDLGAHVSGSIYEPTRHSSQEARMTAILKSSQFRDLVSWAKARASGEVEDPVNGATHFLAHETTMLELERKNPSLYKSWRKWTKFDPNTNQYPNVIMRDGSHAFLAPDGKGQLVPVKMAPDLPFKMQDVNSNFALKIMERMGTWVKEEKTLLKSAIGDMYRASIEGFPPNDRDISNIRSRLSTIGGDPALEVSLRMNLYIGNKLKQHRFTTINEDLRELDKVERVIARRGSAKKEDIAYRDALRARMKLKEQEFPSNPVGYIMKTLPGGGIKPLSMRTIGEASPDDLKKMLTSRIALIGQVSGRMGYLPATMPLLSKEEVQVINKEFTGNPEFIIPMSQKLAAAIGQRGAERIFAQLSKDSPSIGLIAQGMAAAGGEKPSEVFSLAHRRLIGDKKHPESKQPLGNGFDRAFNETYARTVPAAIQSVAPDFRERIKGVVELAYREWIATAGTASNASRATEIVTSKVQEFIRQSFGGVKDSDGATYGGIARVGGVLWGGYETVVPSYMNAQRFSSLFNNRNSKGGDTTPVINVKLLQKAFGSAPMFMDGRTITQEDLSKALWIPIGDNRYALAQKGSYGAYDNSTAGARFFKQRLPGGNLGNYVVSFDELVPYIRKEVGEEIGGPRSPRSVIKYGFATPAELARQPEEDDQ